MLLAFIFWLQQRARKLLKTVNSMNNEEKKKFITEVHKTYMSIRPYDGSFGLKKMKENEDKFWEIYSQRFSSLIPNIFYKYRICSEQNFEAFSDDFAWFSTPDEFGDIVDSTLNTDIESELKELEKDPQKHIRKISIAIINCMLAPYGQTVDEKMLDLVLPLFNENGEVKPDDAKRFLNNYVPEYAGDKYASQLVNATQLSNQQNIKDAVKGFLNVYLDFNKKIRKDSFAYSLAEEKDNLAMWETYAQGATGFCIEYEFPNNTFLGQRMILNLFPIYYGQKEPIKFFDILVRGLQAKQQVNGITYEDYANWFLSSFTKDNSYSFQKEWRIVFTREMGGNKQSFPFAKSIILGEKISDINKDRLIGLAKGKGIKIYQRKLSASGAKVITEEILY